MKITKYVVGLKKHGKQKRCLLQNMVLLHVVGDNCSIPFHPSKTKVHKAFKVLARFFKGPLPLLTQDIVHFYNIFGPPQLNIIPPSIAHLELSCKLRGAAP